MQKVTLGILAHVDSGKTTLSEGLLYASGALRKLGRVDHGDAFLDTDALERERGITIFSKQAMLFAGDKEFTLLDTPGHVDFSAEMERTLSVLDYAVLVISGSDGVQSHTRTLWRLLTRYEVPTFLFINKMDLAGADKDALLRQLTATLSAECVDFSASQETRDEALALCDEAALEQLLERGKIDDALISEMVKNRKVFPCFFRFGAQAGRRGGLSHRARVLHARAGLSEGIRRKGLQDLARRAGRAAHVAQGHRRRAAREGTSHLSRAESGLQ